jgi:hypothetical protein
LVLRAGGSAQVELDNAGAGELGDLLFVDASTAVWTPAGTSDAATAPSREGRREQDGEVPLHYRPLRSAALRAPHSSEGRRGRSGLASRRGSAIAVMT